VAEPPQQGPWAPEAEAAAYPVTAEVEGQEEYERLLPLVKWLLLLPHYLVLIVLGLAAVVAVVISAFAVLFTQRYPRGLFDFVLNVHRWAWRVAAYLLLMTDRYPPFALGDVSDSPARLAIAYPDEEIDRWRPFVQWLLSIPYMVITGMLRSLAVMLAFFTLFVILFTKRYPVGMFAMVLVSMRWQVRANAYAGFMITRYPPFVWA
jgi:Domain of unknown function (DUF4389)